MISYDMFDLTWLNSYDFTSFHMISSCLHHDITWNIDLYSWLGILRSRKHDFFSSAWWSQSAASEVENPWDPWVIIHVLAWCVPTLNGVYGILWGFPSGFMGFIWDLWDETNIFALKTNGWKISFRLPFWGPVLCLFLGRAHLTCNLLTNTAWHMYFWFG